MISIIFKYYHAKLKRNENKTEKVKTLHNLLIFWHTLFIHTILNNTYTLLF